MKNRVIAVLAIAGAAAAIYAYRSRGRTPSDRIVVSGNIELTEVNIGFKTAGRLVERPVTEGDPVKLAQARRRYDAGVAGSLEVTDAQTRLERARDNQIAALFQHNVARVDLAQAMGNVRSVLQ